MRKRLSNSLFFTRKTGAALTPGTENRKGKKMRTVSAILLLLMALGAGADVYEFYWDDGSCAGGWVWYTGGGYWAVEFDEEKTTDQPGTVTSVGAYVFPNWPDGSYQGANLHVFSDSGGL